MIVCNPSLGMRPETGSGGEVYERELIARLRHRQKTDVHVYVPQKGFGRPPLVWFEMAAAIRRCKRLHRPDVLRIHSLRYLGPAAFLAGGSQIQTIVHVHHLEPGPWRPLEKWVLRRADKITVDSVFGMTQVVAAGVWDTTKIHGVPGGVDTTKFYPQYISPWPSVRFLGERKWRKNPEFLDKLRLQGFQVSYRGPGWPAGPLQEALKPDFYRYASLVVFPSLLEGFGLPVLEAMASGVPVIVSTQPALMELVQDGVQGRVLPLDLDLWVQTIKELLNDPETRRKMGEQGVLRAQGYTWELAADKWIQAASS